jgi:hypothetical protein
MSNPIYVPVKKVRNFKVTAIETVYEVHKGTNTVVTDTENVILNEKVYQATSKELAIYEAYKDIEKAGKAKLSDVRVEANPF